MITAEKIKKSQAKHIVNLFEQITRSDILARLGKFDNLGYIDYAIKTVELTDELREYIFGTSDRVVLGHRWNLFSEEKPKKKKRKEMSQKKKNKNKKKKKKFEIF